MAWVHNMEVLLDAKEPLRHATGTEPLPDPTTRPKDQKAWCFDDKQARMWIRANCEDQQHAHIDNCKTSKEAWDAMGQVHGTYSQGRLYFLKTKFFLHKAGAAESVDDVKTELCKIRKMIRNVRATEVPTEFDVPWVPQPHYK